MRFALVSGYQTFFATSGITRQ